MAYFGSITIKDIIVHLKQIINVLNRPSWQNPTSGAIRLVDTLTTCSTVTTLTNTVGICPSTAAPGAAAAGLAVWDAMTTIPMRSEWALNVRRNIT